MFRFNALPVFLVFALFLVSFVYCEDAVVLATTNPPGEAVYDSGSEIVLTWIYKPIDKTVDEKAKSQYFLLSDIEKIDIGLMTGSDNQNRLVKNLTTVKPNDKKEFSFKAPKFKFSGVLFYFRYVVYYKDGKKGPYENGKESYTINWSTRFDIFSDQATGKGELIDVKTLIPDPNKPTAVKSYSPPPSEVVTIINPDRSSSELTSTLSALTLVGLAILSTFL